MATTNQTSFSGGEITPELEGRVDLAKYQIGASTIKNFLVQKHGGMTMRQGTQLVGQEPLSQVDYQDSLYPYRLIPFEFSSSDTYVLVFIKSNPMMVLKNGAFVQSGGSNYSVAHPFSALTDFRDLKYTQDADNLYIAHPSHPTYQLTRTSDTNWTFTAMTFAAPTPPTAVVATRYLNAAVSPAAANLRAVKYSVTAIDAFGNESEIATAVSVNIDSSWPLGSKMHISWTKATGATRYNVYKNSRNYWGYIGTVNADAVTNPVVDMLTDYAFIDDRIEENAGEGPPEWPTSQFGAPGSYPGAIGIFEQRMMYARTNDQPNTVFGSQTGDFQNMSVSFPLKATDAIEATIASGQINKIQHLVPLKDLLVFTSGAEWVMSHGDNTDVLSPTSVQFKVQGNRGCSSIRPEVIGNSVVFVERDGSTVRDFQYSFDSDGFAGADLTVLAPHLFQGFTILDWAYQQSPDSILWVVRSDGAVLALTYLREQEVWAWSQHTFAGTQEMYDNVESSSGIASASLLGVEPWGKAMAVCAITGGSAGDYVYFITWRTTIDKLNSSDGYICVERLSDKTNIDPHINGCYLDCALRYSGGATTTPFGTFAGSDATFMIYGDEDANDPDSGRLGVVADGVVLTRVAGTPAAGEFTYENYTITLGTAAEEVVAGIPYWSEFNSLPLVVGNPRGAPSYGDRNRVAKVTLRVHKSRGAKVGTDIDNLVDIPWEDPAGEAVIAPKSQDFTVPIDNSRSTQPRVFISQKEPSPFTLLSFTAEVEVGD